MAESICRRLSGWFQRIRPYLRYGGKHPGRWDVYDVPGFLKFCLTTFCGFFAAEFALHASSGVGALTFSGLAGVACSVAVMAFGRLIFVLLKKWLPKWLIDVVDPTPHTEHTVRFEQQPHGLTPEEITAETDPHSKEVTS